MTTNYKQILADLDNSVIVCRQTMRKAIEDALHQVDDFNEITANHKRLVRQLDVALNGNEGAAKQASLCDIVAQVQGMTAKPPYYLHVIRDESGDLYKEMVTSDKSSITAFGTPGISYSTDHSVTTQAMILVGSINYQGEQNG